MDERYERFPALLPGHNRHASKPMLIAETASREGRGGKAAWIRDAFLSALPSRFPRIRGVGWSDEQKERDWRVDSSAPTLAAYREVVASYR